MVKFFRDSGSLIVCLLVVFISPAHAERTEFDNRYDGKLVPYADLGIGLGMHVLPDSDEGTSSRVIKAALGIQWLPFISTQFGLWHWSSLSDRPKDEPIREGGTKKSDPVRFEGMSASWELTLQVPVSSQRTVLSYGPYYRIGWHCWTGVLTGLMQPWSKEGCSDLHSLGFVFPVTDRKGGDTVLYIEVSHSELDSLSTRSMQLGAKLPF